MGKQFGAQVIGSVLKLREEGYTLREIAKKLGFEHIQIKKLVHRHNRKQRLGLMPPKSKGRPRKTIPTTVHALELRVKQLEREIELYRSFLLEAGRRRERR